MGDDGVKKTAKRRCLGCMQSDDKYKLLRVVVKNSALMLDKKQNQAGRGAYFHQDCCEKCYSTKRWEMALRLKAGSLKIRDLQRVLGELAPATTQKRIRL